MCGYGQAKDDDFDWTRKKGSTSSTSTGPTKDHTLGTGKNKMPASEDEVSASSYGCQYKVKIVYFVTLRHNRYFH